VSLEYRAEREPLVDMVSKTLICEFCNHTMRKDRLGQHVKVRHIKQLAEQFINDSEGKGLDDNNPLSNMIRCHKRIKVYSKTNPKAFFLFGIIGKYFEEKDDVDAYLENPDNLIQHNIYLQKVLSHIPLSQFLKKSMIYGTIVRENRTLKLENALLSSSVKTLIENQELNEDLLHYTM
jgi:hypothetical protein